MLVMNRQGSETWKECMLRYAEPFGLEDEVTTVYERFMTDGEDESMAAYYALAEWDLLDFVDGD